MRLRHLIASLLASVACLPWVGAAAESAPTLNLDLGGGVSLPVVLIPKGTYMQGSPTSEADRGNDEVERFVNLTSDFYLGKTAVTVAQWERFAQETGYRTEAESGPSGGFGWAGDSLVQKKEFTWRSPGFSQSPDHPVTIISYPDAEAFCEWLSRKVKRKVTLPTEAQWEYACRAGTTTAWHNQGDEAGSDAIAWHKKNAASQTHPAASAAANPWGLHIGGNVAEWCQDWYAPYESGPLTDPVQTNASLSDKPRRVLRGGSWNRDAKNTRSAARFRSDARSRNADIGFRILCSVTEVATPPAPAKTSAPSQGGLLPRMDGQGEISVGHPKDTSSTPPTASAHGDASSGPAVSKGGPMDFVIGLACFLCPFGILAIIIVLVVKAIKKRSANAGAPPLPSGTTTGAAMAAALQGASGNRRQTRVRIVDDGFWLLLDVARGTGVQYVYHPQGGMDVTGQTQYQPSAEGQFVYTGARPESVRVTQAGGVPLDNAFAYDSDNDDNRRNMNRDDDFRQRDDTPGYPSAY
ncbi:MAG: formylglycine-generating enzyme family protein [Verrucomicrobium sp.]